jgi:hypothetical protein
MLLVLPAVLIGLWLGQAIGLGMAAIYTGAVSGLVTLVGSHGNFRQSTPLATSTGCLLVLLTAIAVLVTPLPTLAAATFALIAFASSVASSATPVGLLLALVSSTFYLFATAFAIVLFRDNEMSMWIIIIAALIGVVCGMVIVALRAVIEHRSAPSVARSRNNPSRSFETMRKSLFEFRRGPRDGVRRAIALGLAAYWFELVPQHDSVIILLTVSVLLPVEGRVTVLMGSYRLFGAYLSVGLALSLTLFLPMIAIYVLAIGALVFAVTVTARSTTQAITAISISYLLFLGAPGRDFGIYAGGRLVEAAAGFALAVLAGYVLWPRQPLTVVPIPDDLVAQSSKLNIFK